MGEARGKLEMARRSVSEMAGLEVPAGKVGVAWDQRAAATPFGQMPYFIESLHLSGGRARRIVVLHRPIRGEVAIEDQAQQVLGFIEARSKTKTHEQAVMVTTLPDAPSICR